MNRFPLALVAGLAGGVAWVLGLMLFFGPAQGVLTDPARQSAKFLDVMGRLDPPPRAAGALWILPVGCLVMGMVHGLVYAGIRNGLGVALVLLELALWLSVMLAVGLAVAGVYEGLAGRLGAPRARRTAS